MKKSNKTLLPFIVMLVGSLLLVTTLFLPYTSAVGDYAESLEAMPDMVVYDEADMTAADMTDVSMFDYVRIYGSMLDTYSAGIINIVLVVIIGVFAVLDVLFSVLRKGVPVIVFSILGTIVFLIQNWDFTDRGVAPSVRYDWGIAYYVFFAAALITLAGAVFMVVCKVQAKKSPTLQQI